MKPELLDQLVEAVLYEGHMLYPYRPSSRKNGLRFSFGRVYPKTFAVAQKGAERCTLQTQCLFRRRDDAAEVEIAVRFLQPLMREIGVVSEPLHFWPATREPALFFVPAYEVDGGIYQSWQEAIEREICLSIQPGAPSAAVPFSFRASRTLEPIRDRTDRVAAVVVRHQPAIAGTIEFAAEAVEVGADLFRLTLRVSNSSKPPVGSLAETEAVLPWTFASTHLILRSGAGDFVSLTDPPADCAAAAAGCRNSGVWPVLIGDETLEECDTMLASPIRLADYPQIAAESAGGLCDSTEIDEIPSLRILTMTGPILRSAARSSTIIRAS